MSTTQQSELTTRNQVRGTVTDVRLGGVMAEVSVDVGGDECVAAITRQSAEWLGLHEGDDVTALAKATEVMVARGNKRLEQLSTRNQIPGTVSGIATGVVMSEVRVDVDGNEFVAAVNRQSVERLGLSEGDDVLLLVKATEMMLAK